MKKIILGIVIILCLLNFTGITTAVDNQLTIAFVPKSLDNPIFLDTFEAAEKKAAELGVKMEWIAPFTTSTEGQVRVIERLIAQNVDGIIISANNSESLCRVIDRAVDNGIPVATFDSDSPQSKRLFYIGTDNYAAGRAIGNKLIEVIENGGNKQEKYNLMILTGDRGALNLNKRVIAFRKEIQKEIELNKVDILYCNDNIQRAIELVEEYVGSHPELDIIFFAGGWPFYAPADAMPNFQEWAGESGIAVGIDIFYSALVLQKEGLIDYLIGQDFAAMGQKSLHYLVDYIRNGTHPDTYINTGFNYADRSNLEQLLQIYKPWEVR